MASTTFVDGETLIEASWLNDVNDAIYNPAAGIITASSIVSTPAGNIAATDVQAAINELDTEKQPLDALLISLAGQTTAADRIQGYSGVDTAMLYTVGTASGNVPLVGTASDTETVPGLSRRNTTAEAEAGTADVGHMTPLKTAQAIAALGLGGSGQTRANVLVTPGRTLGTTYTNSDGRPIKVSITGGLAGSGGSVSFTVGGVVVAQPVNSNVSGAAFQIDEIIKHGETYVLANVAGVNNITVWSELSL